MGTRHLAVINAPLQRVGGNDTTPPTVVLTSAASDPVYAAFSVTATFSEVVTGFDAAADVSVTNGTAGDPVDSGDGKTYTITITPSDIDALTVQIGASVCTDGAGNANTASNVLNYTSFYSVVHWIDISTLTTLYQDSAKTTPVAAEGDPVGAVADRVTGTGEYVQTVTASKPTYRASVAALNNQPALSLDGNDYLGGAFSSALSQPITIFLVAITSLAANDTFFDGDDGTNSAQFRLLGGAYRLNAGAVLGGGSANTSPHIYCVEFNGSNSKLFVDGVSTLSGNAGTNSIDGLLLGTNVALSSFLTGYITAQVIFNAILTASKKNVVQNTLSAKFGISVTEFS